jgi:hypothetical protein
MIQRLNGINAGAAIENFGDTTSELRSILEECSVAEIGSNGELRIRKI